MWHGLGLELRMLCRGWALMLVASRPVFMPHLSVQSCSPRGSGVQSCSRPIALGGVPTKASSDSSLLHPHPPPHCLTCPAPPLPPPPVLFPQLPGLQSQVASQQRELSALNLELSKKSEDYERIVAQVHARQRELAELATDIAGKRQQVRSLVAPHPLPRPPALLSMPAAVTAPSPLASCLPQHPRAPHLHAAGGAVG